MIEYKYSVTLTYIRRQGDDMREYIFIDQDLDQLKIDIYGSKSRFFKRLDDQCRLYMSKKLPEEHPTESTTYFGLAIANFSLAFLLTRQKHYFEEARRWIHCVIGYEHWGNAHLVDVDLSAAWILFGLSIGYDWLKDDFKEEERLEIEQKICLQSRRMYEFKIDTEGHGWSTNYWQNHNWINLTGLATAGYALRYLGKEPEAWIQCAKDNFAVVYDVLADDGSDYEGVVYWRYGAMWLFIYAHLLKEREGIDYFRKSSFLENTFYYRLYQAAPNLEEQINFGDCHDRRSGQSTAIYYKVASEYDNGHAQYMGDLVVDQFLYREAFGSQIKPGILPECFFELLFYNPKVRSTSFENLPLVKFFEDLGLIVIRNSWNKDAIHFSFKCSTPGGKKQWQKLWEFKNEKNYDCFGLAHQHPDNNSFILHANGVFMAIDDGYNRNVKASDHNMILVDNEGFQDENQNNVFKDYLPDMIGEVEHLVVDDDYVYIVGETAKTYKKEMKMQSCKRQVLYSSLGFFIIYDELVSENDHFYTWVMHGDTKPESLKVSERDNLSGLHYENGPGSMDVYQWASQPVSLQQLENNVKAIMTTQEPDKYSETRMKTVHVTSDIKSKSMEFISILVPYPTKARSDVKVSVFEENDLHGICVKKDGMENVFLTTKDIRIKYQQWDVDAKCAALTIKDGKLMKVVRLR